jgi:ferric-dicitrate binding protein FerR (iron transport regulator)
MNNTEFEALLNKYLTGIITRQELRLLNNMLKNFEYRQQLEQLINSELEDHAFEGLQDDQMLALIQQNLQQRISAERKRPKLLSLYYIKWISVAASFMVLATGIVYWLQVLRNKHHQPVAVNTPIKTDNTIKPGGNKAILKLADGTELVLDSAATGTLAQQGQAKIIKLSDGRLSYKTDNATPAEVLYNTITTPKGGQYQVLLADGSKVWLNALSSLRFPATFNGKERMVELTGEGYFEVAKNPSHPFIVNILSSTGGVGRGRHVEVLGTHFNINAYADEPAVKTTLLEGSVKVSSSKQTSILKPGQQAAMATEGNITVVNDADIDAVMAWKNGMFYFNSADIETILRQAARWYDVQFEYQALIKEHFSGQISRNVNLDKLLKILQLTGKVNFEINGKTVTVKS